MFLFDTVWKVLVNKALCFLIEAVKVQKQMLNHEEKSNTNANLTSFLKQVQTRVIQWITGHLKELLKIKMTDSRRKVYQD